MWPSQIDYQDAIQEPSTCFTDPVLQAATSADLTAFGAPLPITGQFANVYRMRLSDGRLGAVRLFKGAQKDRTRRYSAITGHLAGLEKESKMPSSIVPFQYQVQGITIENALYPLVITKWVNGSTLNQYVQENLTSPGRIAHLAEKWRLLIGDLMTAHIAHGDLQHGNILVETLDDGEPMLRLIDYDGMFVPALWGEQSPETGHPAYQHPFRTTLHFGPKLDRFSALVIYAALNALAVAPALWPELDNGDNLLFRREDFANDTQSRAFRLLIDALRWYPRALHTVIALRDACRSLPTLVPDLDRL